MATKLTYNKVNLSGKTAIITGANSGIGYVTARDLVSMGGRVILACRSEERGKEAVEKITAYCGENSSDVKPGSAEFVKLDLSSLKSVEGFVEEFKKKECQLQLLICNAGSVFSSRELTEDDNEKTFQVNYLAHFLLTLLLLPLMKNSGSDCRVVLVSSGGYRGGTLDLNDMKAEKSFDTLRSYCNSKFFQVLSMFALKKRLRKTNIKIYAVHPGMIETNIVQKCVEYKESVKNMWQESKEKGLVTDTEQGAMTTLMAATQHYDTDCIYIAEGQPEQLLPQARDEESQEKLWCYSLDRLENYIPEDLRTEYNL